MYDYNRDKVKRDFARFLGINRDKVYRDSTCFSGVNRYV